MTDKQLHSYDYYLVMLSAGKDSISSFLHLLERGVDVSKIEFWHHEVDGREGSKLMDWPCTTSYCQVFADHFGLPLYFSWKVDGFEGELTRENARTKPTRFQTPTGEVHQVGGTSGKFGTRRRFPAQSGSLQSRWCSSALKIDVARIAIRNMERFRNARTLMITGERAEESPKRATYLEFEVDQADGRNTKHKRLVDRWRPVLHWPESDVWQIMESWKIRVHPAYKLGFSRVSCAACIFLSANAWATLNRINPDQVQRIANYEKEFDHSINTKKRKGQTIPVWVTDMVNAGVIHEGIKDEDVHAALDHNYSLPAIDDSWEVPLGAYGEACGPI